MNLQEKMQILAEILDLDVSEFSSETKLEELQEWDSLAALSYIVVMNEKFSKVVKPEEVRKLKTIQDVLDTM